MYSLTRIAQERGLWKQMIEFALDIMLLSSTIFHLLSSFIYYCFDLIVKKYETNNIPKCTPFWHEMFKIASLSGAPPQTPLRELTTLPQTPFWPSAIAASLLQRLKFP